MLNWSSTFPPTQCAEWVDPACFVTLALIVRFLKRGKVGDDEAFLLTGLVAGYYSRKILTISSPCNDSIKHDKHRQRKPEEERDDREEVDLAVGHHGINHGLTTDCGAKSNDFVPDEKPSSKLDQHQLCKSGSLDLPCSWQLPTWKGIWTPHCGRVDRDFNYLYKPMRDDGFWHSQWRGQDHRKKPWDETNLKIEFFMYISFSHEVESLIFQFSNSYEKNSHQSCLSFCPDPSSM